MNLRPKFPRFFGGISTIVIGVLLIIFTGWYLLVGFEAGDNEAMAALESMSLEHIELGHADRWQCGEDDSSSRTFTARTVNGRMARGVVCCSVIGCGKGCTVRFNP